MSTSLQSGRRLPRNCDCKYQEEKPYGYEVFDWTGFSWKSVANASSVLLAFEAGDAFKQILICCRGCGKEMFRERAAFFQEENQLFAITEQLNPCICKNNFGLGHDPGCQVISILPEEQRKKALEEIVQRFFGNSE